MSDSVRPHRRQPTRLPCPWDSPGKNTGVGCHFLLQCMKMKSESEVAQSCPTVVSDSLWPHGLQPTSLLHPWDLPGKSTGVGCHRLQYIALMCSFSYLEPVCCSMYSSNCFSGDRSGGLVFPSLEECSTVYCDPHSQKLCHISARLLQTRKYKGIWRI